MLNKAFWNWQNYLKLSCTQQRLIQNRTCEDDTRTWKRCTATEQLASRADLLAVASTWRANTALCHTLVRCGEWMASKHCSLSCCSSPWREDYSSWQIMTNFCREVQFFTPKTQFSSTPTPNLIGNSTCDDSTT